MILYPYAALNTSRRESGEGVDKDERKPPKNPIPKRPKRNAKKKRR